MHPDEFRNVWVCYECHQCFIFEDDKDEHLKTTLHKELKRYDIAEVLDRYQATNVQHEKFTQEGERSKW